MSDTTTLKITNLEVKKFGLKNMKREFAIVTMPFSTAKELFSAERYRADTGNGEQRDLVMSHVKVIRKEIEDGNYTPTTVTVGVRQQGSPATEIEKNSDGTINVLLSGGKKLPLLDGGHRFEAFCNLWEQEAFKEEIGNSDVTAVILLDGNTKKDFLNLQKGRPVDKSHLHSLSVQEKLLAAKDANILTLAYDTAKILNSDENSPFHKQIRFDSAGVSGIPVSSLSGKGASDISTSLVGGAKIAIEVGKDAAWLAKHIVMAYSYVTKNAPELTASGMKLTPPPSGTKGSATMLIGIGNMLAARVMLKNNSFADTHDVEKLVEACKKALFEPVKGNFSGAYKRNLMGKLAEVYFSDLISPETSHFGVPKKLVQILSTSTFSTPKMEKEKKVKPVAVVKEKKKKESEPVKPVETLDFGEEDGKVIEEPKNDFSVTTNAPWEDG
jgi:hypothetical protein